MSDHTFVIPAYKDSPYLESCIQSLRNQTVKSEIVLTTSTPSVFLQDLTAKYGINYFINPDSSSISGDWNFALSKVKTSMATIAHQDDIYEPEFAERVTDGIKQEPEALIAFTNYTDLIAGKIRGFSLNAFVKAAMLWPFFFSRSIRSKFGKKSILLFGDPIACPAVTFNLGALNHDFSFSKEYSCALDWYAWLELSQREGSFLYIKQKLLQHRIHPDSETTNQLSLGKRQKEEYQIFEQMWGTRIAKVISRLYSAGYRDNQL